MSKKLVNGFWGGINKMMIQIPWKRKYYCQIAFLRFVPKICNYIDKDGNIFSEKNKEAKFKILK